MRTEITSFMQVMTQEILEANPKFPLDRVETLRGLAESEFETIYDYENRGSPFENEETDSKDEVGTPAR